MKVLLTLTVLAAWATPAAAQWVNQPTPGIPRTVDGKPNLSARRPSTPDGKPDLTGLWNGEARRGAPDTADVQAWVKDVLRQQENVFFKGRPSNQCLPAPFETTGGWMRIIQTPTLIAILRPDLTHRVIFMDGRKLENDPHRTWMGYSVGRWEGNTLVVDSFGFNDKTWLSARGFQHTEALRVTERYRRPDFGHLEIEVTYSDVGAYRRPWGITATLELAADTEMIEAVCETGSEGWTGTLSDTRASAPRIAADVLAQYVGVYSGIYAGRPRTVEVTVADGELFITIGGEKDSMVATSDTSFESSRGLAYEFIREGGGPATAIVEIHVSGNYRYARQR